MSQELVQLRCFKCDEPLRLVDKALAAMWRSPRCPQISPRIGRFGFIDEKGLTTCQRNALKSAIHREEIEEERRAAGVSNTDWESYSREQREQFFWAIKKQQQKTG